LVFASTKIYDKSFWVRVFRFGRFWRPTIGYSSVHSNHGNA
jgi:hypothetical protein